MSGLIRQSIGPRKSCLVKLIADGRTFKNQSVPVETTARTHFKELIEDHVVKLQQSVTGLEKANTQWIELVSRMEDPTAEEAHYGKTAAGTDGYLQVIDDANQLIGLLELKLKRIADCNADVSTPNTTQASSHGVASTTASSKHATIKLPKLEMPKFAGDYFEWNHFWTVYKEAIHEADFTGVQKFSYLRSYLTGAALDTIDGIDITNNNYDIAVSTLISRFERTPEQMVGGLYSKLKRLPTSGGSVAELQKTFDLCSKILRQLQNAGEDTNSNRSLVLDYFSKFPGAMVEEVCRRKQVGTRSTLTEVQSAVKQYIEESDDLHELMDDLKPFTGSSCNSRQSSNRVYSKSNDQTYATSSETSNKPATNTSALTVSDDTEKRPTAPKSPCYFCKGPHYNSMCDRYVTTESRIKRLNELSRCPRCLGSNHTSESCRTSERKLYCFFCRTTGNHVSPLCPVKFAGSSQQKSKTDAKQKSIEKSTDGGHETCALSVDEHAVLATAVASIFNPETGKEVKARIIFDNGSHRSYITEKLSATLTLASKQRDTLMVSVFGTNKSLAVNANQVKFQILQRDGSKADVAAHTTPLITKCDVSPVRLPGSTQKLLDSLSYAMADDFVTLPPGPPDVLLGSDYFWEFITGKAQLQSDDGIHLIPTKLGLILGGRYQSQYESKLEQASLLCLTESTCQTRINQVSSLNMITTESKHQKDPDIDEFWALETVGISESPVETDDESAMKQFEESIVFENGRYHVCWPWKESKSQLPTNYQLALGRLRSLIKRFSLSSSDMVQNYDKLIRDQLELGIIEEVPPDNYFDTTAQVHYLPHHPVIRSDHQTTKIRIVYDASAKCGKQQSSLNQCLYRGPVILPDLCSILIRFRLNPVAIIADIEKAFLQLGLQSDQRDVTRFLWLKDSSSMTTEGNLVVYRFVRVPFGVISSPFLLGGTVQHHLKQVNTPVSDNIRNNIYVDNVFGGTPTVHASVEFYNEAKSIFRDAGMNLREWCSNSDVFMDTIPAEDRTSCRVVKVLGLQWDSKSDTICLLKNWANLRHCSTKRQVLQAVASVYDPLGFFQPCTLPAKLFLRDLWQASSTWDEIISHELQEKWFTLHDSISPIFGVSIPRCVLAEKSSDVSIVMFSDASAEAYATCVYLRTKNPDHSVGGWVSNLIYSKSRLAPKSKSQSQISIPRLELLGLMIGSRSVKFVRNAILSQVGSVRAFLFSDSMSVLGWLKTAKVQQRFVSNRISEIRKIQDAEFRYVKSEENPADLCTRGMCGDEIIGSSMWWNGPKWLSYDTSEWPVKDDLAPFTDEILGQIEEKSGEQPVFHALLAGECLQEPRYPFQINPRTFSTASRLFRVTAFCIKFLKRMVWDKLSNDSQQRNPLNQLLNTVQTDNVSTITAVELTVSKRLWIRAIQSNNYQGVLVAIQVNRSHQLVNQLGLQLDEHGIIRCCGRLQFAELPPGAIEPALLPRRDYVTELLVWESHGKLFHSGVSHTLSQMRRLYWVPQGRNFIRKLLSKCVICRKYKGQPFALPKMPPWPRQRVSRSKPFQYTGLDYFGPVKVKLTNDGSVGKMWVCLFTCLAVRAIHLEWVSDCTAQSFIECVSRFIARRGCPTEFISDNAPQFRLAKDLFDQTWKKVYRDESVQCYIADQGASWKFTTELAPWQGGFYERLIGMVKTSFRSVVGRKLLRWDEFATLITEIEAITNSRPIVYVGADFAFGLSLRPVDFLSQSLAGTPSVDPKCPPGNGEAASFLMRHWKFKQRRLDIIWQQWRNDYLKNLREKSQPVHKGRHGEVHSSPSEGEVVLVKNEDAPRGTWKMDRVVKVIESVDGAIRSVELMLPNRHTIKRPINHLFSLELPSSIPDSSEYNDEEPDFDGFSLSEVDGIGPQDQQHDVVNFVGDLMNSEIFDNLNSHAMKLSFERQ